MLSAELDLPGEVSRRVVRLLEEGNSIPFLARYRREQTGGMQPDTLRLFKESYENLKAVQEKCTKLLSTLDKSGKSTPAARQALVAARSLSELDHAFAPFKTGSKATLAERARQLGLEPMAVEIIEGMRFSWDLTCLIDGSMAGRSNLAEVEAGLQHILADVIVHDKTTCDLIRDLQRQARIELQVKKATAASASSSVKAKVGKTTSAKATAATANSGNKAKSKEEEKKFENYYNLPVPWPW